MNIAIVGMACAYPDAPHPAALWESVMWRRRAFRRIPAERLSLSDYHSPDRSSADRTYSTRAALIEGWEFDRTAYRIPAAVHRVSDPAHWLALDTAAHALADAGFPGADGLARERVAVVVGNTLAGEVTRAHALRLRWPYVRDVLACALADLPVETGVRVLERAERDYLSPFPEFSDESLAGAQPTMIAGHVCRHFDLGGGGYAVDGACASSLLAVISACRTLREGGADFVLAGGVDVSLDPFELVGLAKTGVLAADRMRVYDERAGGFWPGEGCGFVALMRAGDARDLGLRIHAEIAGWGVSSGGADAADGQVLALRRAYAHAGVLPGEVALFEGHGAGTSAGDTAELTALTRLLSTSRPAFPAALGSVKANIGHTKAAAGVAGLIKAALSLAAGTLPPTTGCENPHKLLTGPASPLRILDAPEPWPDGPRYAGVSAAGVGGLNAHLVVSGTAEAPMSSTPAGVRGAYPVSERRVLPEGLPSRDDPLVFAISGEDVLGTLRRIADQATCWSEAELVDLARALGTRPGGAPGTAGDAGQAGGRRVALVAGSPEQLAERAAVAADRWERLRPGVLDAAPGVFAGDGVRGRVTLLFPGQGAPVRSPDGRVRDGVADTAEAQPAILAASLAALRKLDRLGVTAGAAVGHSLGEIAGLVWAGSLTVKDARRLVRRRGHIMSELGRPGAGMVSVGAGREVAEQLARGTALVLAAVNGPASCVLAGSLEELAVAVRRAAERGVPTTALPVSRAFHSPLVADCAAAMADFLKDVRFRPPVRTLISTVTGAPLSPDDDPALLLHRQITAPVRFWDAVCHVAGDTDLFCEAGPGRTLSALIEGVPAVSVDAFGRSAAPAAETAAALWAAGAIPDLSPLYGDLPGRPMDIWRDRVFIANPCSRLRGNDTACGEAGGFLPAEEVVWLVRDLVAAEAGLPVESVTDDMFLLGDLKVTSTARLAAGAARAAGRRRPVAPPAGDITVADLAECIAALPPAGPDGDRTPPTPVPGVAPWVRCFAEPAYPDFVGPGSSPPAQETVPQADPLHPQEITKLVQDTAPRPAPVRRSRQEAVATDDPLRPQEITKLVQGSGGRPAAARRRPLGITAPRLHHPRTLVVGDPLDPEEIARLLRAARKALADGTGFTVAADGGALAGFARSLHLEHPDVFTGDPRPQPLPIPLPGDGPLPVGPDDVVLVSGGGKGIGLACATGLAEASGCALGLVGRASPDDDQVLRANLAALAERGVRHAYALADIGDEAAAAGAVRLLTDALGPITMLIHAAAVNRPARFAELGDDEIVAHLTPKVAGLSHLVAAASPKHIVTFGSVAGTYGMAGESHYALAAGLMREQSRRLGGLNIDWTTWSDVRDPACDVTPLPEREGVEVFLKLLRTPGLPPSVAVHGRLGQPPAPCPGRGRFVDDVRVHYPGVELVADSVVSLASDPCLGDHRPGGTAVLPAVVALEALAQAAAVVAGRRVSEIADMSFDRPVTVPEGGGTTVRVCALRRDDVIEVVLRSEETGFQADHVRAVFPVASTRGAHSPPAGTQTAQNRGEPLTADEIYGPLCFQTGRFRRVTRLTLVEPHACAGEVRGDEPEGWFGGASPLLGSPGVADATIHALQACVPHRRLLPAGAERLVIHPEAGRGDVRLSARERHGDIAEYVWDVEAVNGEGRPVATWTGLRLKDAGPLPRVDPWPPSLLAVYLQRAAVALGLSPSLRVSVDRPEAGCSRSHLAGHVLSTASPATCGWERVGGAVPALGPGLTPLVNELQPRCDEPRDTVATRVWNAVECLSKAGLPPSAPLAVEGVFDGGWALLRSGSNLIASTVVRIRGVDEAVSIALMAEGGG
ncbi:type I polyketide synthase [Sinosporangium siamense]|uniref:Polyketide synthase n=1 Tax=Sinosporangium siamense TaxID=1367973 RepID=A0A919RER6_9ACTN|nr:type I polyketide synthase [Sinosporangium siamense]GII92556.1 polyketide synthase [Sinosporangium siamense]